MHLLSLLLYGWITIFYMEFVGYAPLGPFIPAEYFVILEFEKES